MSMVVRREDIVRQEQEKNALDNKNHEAAEIPIRHNRCRRRTHRCLRYLEFYAGIGGWRLALEQAMAAIMVDADNLVPVETHCVAALDHSDLCVQVYQFNFGTNHHYNPPPLVAPTATDSTRSRAAAAATNDQDNQGDHKKDYEIKDTINHYHRNNHDCHKKSKNPKAKTTTRTTDQRRQKRPDRTNNTTMKTRSIENLTCHDLTYELQADLWFLSPPCQPHTRQHEHQAMERNDPRSHSFHHLCQLLRDLPDAALPTLISLENVVHFETSHSCQEWRQTLQARHYQLAEFRPLTPTQVQLPNERPRYFCLAILLRTQQPQRQEQRPDRNPSIASIAASTDGISAKTSTESRGPNSSNNGGGSSTKQQPQPQAALDNRQQQLLLKYFACSSSAQECGNTGDTATVSTSLAAAATTIKPPSLESIVFHTSVPEFGIAPPPLLDPMDVDDHGTSTSRSNNPSLVPPIRDFLDDSNDVNDENGDHKDVDSLRVPSKVLERNAAWCFDIVTPDSTRSSCFTSSYGKFVRGTGSILLYHDNNNHYNSNSSKKDDKNPNSSSSSSNHENDTDDNNKITNTADSSPSLEALAPPLPPPPQYPLGSLVAPDERVFDHNQWLLQLTNHNNHTSGKKDSDLTGCWSLRYFSGTELARLFGFYDPRREQRRQEQHQQQQQGTIANPPATTPFAFPPTCTRKQEWKLMGNSINTRLASRLIQLGLTASGILTTFSSFDPDQQDNDDGDNDDGDNDDKGVEDDSHKKKNNGADNDGLNAEMK
ncbi:hypothetical protein ACA910_011375 [Epithemia clementina (nom. ined.)]